MTKASRAKAPGKWIAIYSDGDFYVGEGASAQEAVDDLIEYLDVSESTLESIELYEVRATYDVKVGGYRFVKREFPNEE